MPGERRRFPRRNQRIPCEFEFAERRHTGIVGDLSARGLFIQCSALPPDGHDLEVVLRAVGEGEMRVRGRVARLARPNRTAFAVAATGFALEIVWAPETYYARLLQPGAA